MRKIAILRGINVGGNKKILMADLKLLFKNIGFTNIATYIQSGNVIFETPNNTENNNELEIEIENKILSKLQLSVPVIVRSAQELNSIVENNMLVKNKQTDKNKLFVTFLKVKPITENIKTLLTFSFGLDIFLFKNKEIYTFCDQKYHLTKLTNSFFEKKLKVTATTRNWKTTLKLLEIATLE